LICNGSERSSLNAKLLLFCFEPSNSEKDDDFFREHRFPTKEDALEVLKQYLECDWSSKEEFKDLTEAELRHYKQQRDRYKEGLADLF
jgi:hypothetical protein